MMKQALIQRRHTHMYDEFGKIGPGGFVPHSDDGKRPAATVLSEFAVLRISGPDSERLLQGQLTCDVTKLTEDTWVPGACCSAKGRMVANFIVVRQGDDFLLRLPALQLQPLLDHLKKYAVFYKTQLAESGLSLLGRIALNSDQRAVANQEDGILLNWPDGREELWTDSPQVISGWLSGPLMPEAEWQNQDIASGWVWVTPASQDAWVPQYIGWQTQGGISFTKGCYTGQEVVARLQYLGKSKRHLYKVYSDDALPDVMTGISRDGKNIGELAAACDRTGLAVISADDAELEARIGDCDIRLEKLFYTEEKAN